MKIQDTVRCAVDETKFLMAVDKMREAMNIPLEHEPVTLTGCETLSAKALRVSSKEVELLSDKFMLTQNERGDVLRKLFMSGDSSRYGLFNAVTAVSQIADSYERATDLERIGGEILAIPVPSRPLLPSVMTATTQKMLNVTPMRELAMA